MSVRQDRRAALTVKAGSVRGLSPTVADSFVSSPGYTVPFQGPGAALSATGGIVFPYTPNVSVAHQVEYSSYETLHTNYQQNAYAKTRNPQLQVTANFISQTPDEARYTIGAMHFLRVVTKMNWGPVDPERGTPPPVLEFSAYGPTNFHRVPVLVQSFNFIYEDGVDYVETEVQGGDGLVHIPALMTIAIDLLPQYAPNKQNQFNLNEFANGSLYGAGFI